MEVGYSLFLRRFAHKSYLCNLVLYGGITSCLASHELSSLHRVTVHRKGDGGLLDSAQSLSKEIACGAVCVYNVKPSTVNIYGATNPDVIDGVGPRPPL